MYVYCLCYSIKWSSLRLKFYFRIIRIIFNYKILFDNSFFLNNY